VTPVLSEQDFIDAGYKRFEQTNHNSADYGLQKCIRDSDGRRYYITVWVYSWKKYQERIPNLKDFGFSPSVQFRDGDWNTVDIDYHMNEDTKVYEIEQLYNMIWETLGRPYYERYETEDVK
jgi:hypothetical protein